MFETVFTIFRYLCSLIFGVVTASAFAGLLRTAKDIRRIVPVILSIGALQAFFFFFLGYETTKNWYPVHTHLLFVLILIFVFKIKTHIAIISTLVAYMCCLIPSMFSRFAMYIPFFKPLPELIFYIISVALFAYALLKFAAKPMRDMIQGRLKTALALAIVPLIYYIFEFTTSIWSDLIYSGNYHIVQFMPLVACCAHIVFVCVFGNEQRRRIDTIHEKNMIKNRLKVVEVEYESLARMQEMSRIYRHDMRHHMVYLQSLADEKKLDEIKNYIQENVKMIDSVTPRRFCDHEMLNLLLSYTADKAEANGIDYNFGIELPEKLPLTPPELCSLVSNALENAVFALLSVPKGERELDVKLKVVNRMLIFSVDNTFSNEVKIVDGIPYTSEEGHGYGTRSIISIAKAHGGFADFSLDGNKFKLLVSLSMDPPR
ncbi:MAG: GHKL domain-containing protein [Lachnospiraceae bacterium]|nr:GHKL domain-containing protein [Lachnospiraceae bacterium]